MFVSITTDPTRKACQYWEAIKIYFLLGAYIVSLAINTVCWFSKRERLTFTFEKVYAKQLSLNNHSVSVIHSKVKIGSHKKEARLAHKNYFPWDRVLWNVTEVLCVYFPLYPIRYSKMWAQEWWFNKPNNFWYSN